MQVLFLIAILVVATIAIVSLMKKDKSGQAIPETKTTIDPEPTVVVEFPDTEPVPAQQAESEQAAPISPAIERLAQKPATKTTPKAKEPIQKKQAKPATKQAAPKTKTTNNKKK